MKSGDTYFQAPTADVHTQNSHGGLIWYILGGLIVPAVAAVEALEQDKQQQGS